MNTPLQIECLPRPCSQKLHADAVARAEAVLPVIHEIQQQSPMSLTDIADELNRRQIPTPRGARWTKVQVRRILQTAPKQIAKPIASPITPSTPQEVQPVPTEAQIRLPEPKNDHPGEHPADPDAQLALLKAMVAEAENQLPHSRISPQIDKLMARISELERRLLPASPGEHPDPATNFDARPLSFRQTHQPFVAPKHYDPLSRSDQRPSGFDPTQFRLQKKVFRIAANGEKVDVYESLSKPRLFVCSCGEVVETRGQLCDRCMKANDTPPVGSPRWHREKLAAPTALDSYSRPSQPEPKFKPRYTTTRWPRG